MENWWTDKGNEKESRYKGLLRQILNHLENIQGHVLKILRNLEVRYWREKGLMEILSSEILSDILIVGMLPRK